MGHELSGRFRPVAEHSAVVAEGQRHQHGFEQRRLHEHQGKDPQDSPLAVLGHEIDALVVVGPFHRLLPGKEMIRSP